VPGLQSATRAEIIPLLETTMIKTDQTSLNMHKTAMRNLASLRETVLTMSSSTREQTDGNMILTIIEERSVLRLII
jgi:hypothetical protein